MSFCCEPLRIRIVFRLIKTNFKQPRGHNLTYRVDKLKRSPAIASQLLPCMHHSPFNSTSYITTAPTDKQMQLSDHFGHDIKYNANLNPILEFT